MRHISKNIAWILPLFATLSCSKSENTQNNEVQTTDKTFAITATQGGMQSKAGETTLEDGFEYFNDGDAIRLGLFSYSDDNKSLTTYSSILTTDIYAKFNEDATTDAASNGLWSYGYGREGTASNVSYKEISNSTPVLAACYPYRDAYDLKHIPFSLPDKQGLMWCTPVEVTNENRDNVPIKFHHSMAKIRIKVDFAQSQNYYFNPRVPNIFGLEACTGTELVESANYDATTGEFSDKKLVNGIFKLNTYSTIKNDDGNYSIDDYDSKYDILIYLVPGLPFNGLEIRMAWEGTSSSTYKYISGLTIDKDKIQIDELSGDEETLMAGYEYTYNITINNYLKFEGITINTNWIDSPDDPFTGNI